MNQSARYPRSLASAVRTALADTPVVCILGPRQVGKTTLARQSEPQFGYVSLDDSASLASTTAPDIDALAGRVVAGGFPEAVGRTPARARTWHQNYLRTLVERDVRDVARIRDARDLSRLLELMALRSGQLLNVSSLATELGIRRETVEHYLSVCERLFLLRRLQPWQRNHAKRLIKTPKVHLVDSGLCATLAGLDAADAIGQRHRFGHLIETFVVQQLTAQAGWTDPGIELWHYRDKEQNEVDLVLTPDPAPPSSCRTRRCSPEMPNRTEPAGPLSVCR